ncbi:MAG: hypothetical protein MUF64_21605 [Polyangiaceae bacterium]|jgi:hypothetical protein|nr:hypothetical protein [Polyangiaceae bacterium]
MTSYHRIPGASCKRQAPLALLLLLALAGCKREGAPGSERVVASSSPINSAPIVRQCYQGCLDINKGKPVDPQELSKNCAHKCTRICAKACAVPRKDLPYEQAMEECSRTCKEQLGPT